MSASCLVSMLACGAAQADQAACRYVKLASLPVVFNDYRPTVIGAVNDKAAVMLVDTGAANTLLTTAGAVRQELTVRAVDNMGTALGVNGESEVKFARVQSVSIGGISGARQDLPVIGQMQGGESIDALVGADFIFQADVEFNLSKPEISFFQPLGCNQAFLAYWSKDAFFVDAKRLSGRDRRLEFTVQVNGHDVDAILDSGASSSLIDTEAAAAAGVSLDSPGVIKVGMSGGIGGNPVPLYLGTFDTITIGSETLHKSKLFISDLRGGYRGSADVALFGPKMLLGADFLKSHRVLFAVSQNRIYFSYLGGKVFASEQLTAPLAPAPATRQQGGAALPTPIALPSPADEPQQKSQQNLQQ